MTLTQLRNTESYLTKVSTLTSNGTNTLIVNGGQAGFSTLTSNKILTLSDINNYASVSLLTVDSTSTFKMLASQTAKCISISNLNAYFVNSRTYYDYYWPGANDTLELSYYCWPSIIVENNQGSWLNGVNFTILSSNVGLISTGKVVRRKSTSTYQGTSGYEITSNYYMQNLSIAYVDFYYTLAYLSSTTTVDKHLYNTFEKICYSFGYSYGYSYSSAWSTNSSGYKYKDYVLRYVPGASSTGAWITQSKMLKNTDQELFEETTVDSVPIYECASNNWGHALYYAGVTYCGYTSFNVGGIVRSGTLYYPSAVGSARLYTCTSSSSPYTLKYGYNSYAILTDVKMRITNGTMHYTLNSGKISMVKQSYYFEDKIEHNVNDAYMRFRKLYLAGNGEPINFYINDVNMNATSATDDSNAWIHLGGILSSNTFGQINTQQITSTRY